MNREEYYHHLLEDPEFFILEVQKKLATNPYFFEIVDDPYDKYSYSKQLEQLSIELFRLFDESSPLMEYP